MSARQDLIDALSEHACCFSDEDAERMVDAFAQELAEKVRTEGAYWGQQSAAGKVYAKGADLIDPVKDPACNQA